MIWYVKLSTLNIKIPNYCCPNANVVWFTLHVFRMKKTAGWMHVCTKLIRLIMSGLMSVFCFWPLYLQCRRPSGVLPFTCMHVRIYWQVNIPVVIFHFVLFVNILVSASIIYCQLNNPLYVIFCCLFTPFLDKSQQLVNCKTYREIARSLVK